MRRERCLLSGRVSERASEGLRREYVFLTLDNIVRLGRESDFTDGSPLSCICRQAKNDTDERERKTVCRKEAHILCVADYFVPLYLMTVQGRDSPAETSRAAGIASGFRRTRRTSRKDGETAEPQVVPHPQTTKHNEMIEVQTEIYEENAVLVGIITPQQSEAKAREYIDELAFLADTAGAHCIKAFFQKLDHANSRTFVGEGKLQEIKAYIANMEESETPVGMVIFDDELSPLQLRNIEKALEVKILDRTNLILDIFAKRAQTASAKTQVELAQGFSVDRSSDVHVLEFTGHAMRKQVAIGVRMECRRCTVRVFPSPVCCSCAMM